MKYFLWIVVSLFSFLSFFWSSSFANSTPDLLEQAFSPAIQTNTVVGGDSIGTTSKNVGNFVLQEGRDLDLKNGFEKRESLIVKVAKFLLRMTIVLAVTMIIYNGIMFMIKYSKGEMPKDVLMNIVYIWAGILLALLSVMIVRLASSAGSSFWGL